MPFPTTSVLSSFTGANEEPLSEGGAFNGPIRVASAAIKAMRRLSNVAAPSSTATTASESYWNTSFSADQEVWGTIAAVPSGTNHIALYTRITNEGLFNVQGYLILYIVGTGVQFYSLTLAGGFVQIGGTVAGAMNVGDKLGLSVVGTTLEGWKDTGSGWASIGTRTDSAVTGAGKIGMWVASSTDAARVDEFGGGAVVAGAEKQSFYVTRRRTVSR